MVRYSTIKKALLGAAVVSALAMFTTGCSASSGPEGSGKCGGDKCGSSKQSSTKCGSGKCGNGK